MIFLYNENLSARIGVKLLFGRADVIFKTQNL